MKTEQITGYRRYMVEWYNKIKEQLIPLPACNATFQGQEIPISWNEAIISPIPKEGKEN